MSNYMGMSTADMLLAFEKKLTEIALLVEPIRETTKRIEGGE